MNHKKKGFLILASLLVMLLLRNSISFAGSSGVQPVDGKIQYIGLEKGEAQVSLEKQFLTYLEGKNAKKLQSLPDVANSSADIFIINSTAKEKDESLIREVKAGKSFVSVGDKILGDVLDLPIKVGDVKDKDDTYEVAASHYFYDRVTGVPAIERFLIPKDSDDESIKKAIPIIINRINEERQKLVSNDHNEKDSLQNTQVSITAEPDWDYLSYVSDYVIDDTEGEVYARYSGYHLLNDSDNTKEYFMLVGNNDYVPGTYNLDKYYETWLPGPVWGGSNPASLKEYGPESANYSSSFSFEIGAVLAGVPSLTVNVSYSGDEPLDIDYLGSGNTAKWAWVYSGEDAVTSTQTVKNSVVYSVPQSEDSVYLEGRWKAYFKHPSFGNNPYGTDTRWVTIDTDNITW